MANWPIDYRQYPDSVVKAIQLSNMEAQYSHQDGIAAEHLLLSLVKEGVSIGARILIKRGFDLRRIRLEVEKRVESRPLKVKLGKRPVLPETLSVLETARRESNELRDFVGFKAVMSFITVNTRRIKLFLVTPLQSVQVCQDFVGPFYVVDDLYVRRILLVAC